MNVNDITVDKVKSFLQGYSRYYFDNIFSLPEYIKEQVYYRLFQCKDTCLINGKCEKCTCPTIQKSYATESCNESKFPNLMSNQEWKDFKIQNNISGLDKMKNQVELIISKSKGNV